MKNRKPTLYQVQFYTGENCEKNKGPGWGISPGNMCNLQIRLEEKLEGVNLIKNFYLDSGIIIEIDKGNRSGYYYGGERWGKIGIRFIANSKKPKIFSKAAKEYGLPFEKDFIIPYPYEEFTL